MVWPAIIGAVGSIAGAGLGAMSSGAASRQSAEQANNQLRLSYALLQEKWNKENFAEQFKNPLERQNEANSALLNTLTAKAGTRNSQRAEEQDSRTQRYAGGELDRLGRNAEMFRADGGMPLSDILKVMTMESQREDPAAQQLVNAMARQAIRTDQSANIEQAAEGGRQSGLAATMGARAKAPSLFQAMAAREGITDKGNDTSGIMQLLAAMQPGAIPQFQTPDYAGKIMQAGASSGALAPGFAQLAQQSGDTANLFSMQSGKGLESLLGGLFKLPKVYENAEKIGNAGTRSIGNTGWYGGPVGNAPSGYGDYTY